MRFVRELLVFVGLVLVVGAVLIACLKLVTMGWGL